MFNRCGTLGFMAPEILNSENNTYNEKVDIFSLGCIFYMLLTGKQPFESNHNLDDYYRNLRRGANLNLVELNFVSPESFDLLKLMLEADPKKRLSA